MFSSVQKYSTYVENYLKMLDIRERIYELFVGPVGSVPGGTCTLSGANLSCNVTLPYLGTPGAVIPEAVYVLENGIISCVPENIRVSYSSLTAGVIQYYRMIISANFNSCTVTQGYVEMALEMVRPITARVQEGANNVVTVFFENAGPPVIFKVFLATQGG